MAMDRDGLADFLRRRREAFEPERIVVVTAAPGSEDAQRLELLSVLGSQEFSGATELAS